MIYTRAIRLLAIRFVPFSIAALIAFSVGAFAQSQTSGPQGDTSGKTVSLGDFARQQRTTPHQKAKRVLTNDDIAPAEATVSQSPTDKRAEAKDDKGKDKAASPEEKEKDQAKPFIEAVEAQKKRIADAQKKIQQLNEESRQRHSAQYADLGVLLRDPQKWNQDEKAIQDEIDAKQKEIQEANVQLEEARERARKNGVKLSD